MTGVVGGNPTPSGGYGGILDRKSKPCIAIGYPQAHEGCACVDIDFAEAGRKAVEASSLYPGFREPQHRG